MLYIKDLVEEPGVALVRGQTMEEGIPYAANNILHLHGRLEYVAPLLNTLDKVISPCQLGD